MTAVATTVAALAACGALYWARRTIRDTRLLADERAKYDRSAAIERLTYETAERLEDPELRKSEAVLSAFLRGGLQPPSIPDATWSSMDPDARRETAPGLWGYLDKSSSLKDRQSVLQILAYPNMLERAAGMYNDGLLEERIVRVMVASSALSFWDQAGWWIKDLRLADSSVFKEIEIMLKNLGLVHPDPHAG